MPLTVSVAGIGTAGPGAAAKPKISKRTLSRVSYRGTAISGKGTASVPEIRLGALAARPAYSGGSGRFLQSFEVGGIAHNVTGADGTEAN